MDKNDYKTLIANKNSQIKIASKEVVQISADILKATGNSIIAGTCRPVNLDVRYSISGDQVTFKESSNITFTDFATAPPTAEFGTIKTGDKLKLSFNATFMPVSK